MGKEYKPKTMEKTDKSPQIVHEAEITRQHARYKIPAKIEIDGKIYKLEDWSVSGCAIENLPDEVFHKKFATGKMMFRFDDFETVVDNLRLEFLQRRPNGVVGCRFTDMTPQQIAILNQIIASYLAGDIITEDDIIHAVTRTITYTKKEKPKVDRKRGLLILLFIYFIIFALLMFLFYVLYKRVYVVQTVNAYVDANLTVVRSPAPSYVYYPQKLQIGQKVKIGEILFRSYLVAGGIQNIASPLNGKIIKISALNGEFRNVAEPILYILPDSNSSIFITAHVLHKDLIKLKLGDIATVVTPEGEKFYAELIKIIPAQTVFHEKAKHLLANIYNQARNYDTLIFYTNYPLNKERINESLFLTIDTFLNRWGLISLNDNNVTKENNNTLLIQNELNETNSTNNSKAYTYENNNTNKNITLNQDNNFTNINVSNTSDKNETNQSAEAVKKEYCIITASAKKFSDKQIKKFLNSFENAKVEKIKNLYEFKIYGFKTYKAAKEFMNKKVIKIYKKPFIIKCERAK